MLSNHDVLLRLREIKGEIDALIDQVSRSAYAPGGLPSTGPVAAGQVHRWVAQANDLAAAQRPPIVPALERLLKDEEQPTWWLERAPACFPFG